MSYLTLLIWFVVGIPLVEFVGYLWHRFVEHNGMLGDRLRYPHYRHHELDYPAENLRPHEDYKSAEDGGWYLLGVITFCIIGIFVILGFFPLRWALAMAIGAIAYARYVVSVFHDLYHVDDVTRIPTIRFQPLPRLIRGVYIRLSRATWFQKKLERLAYLHDLHHYARCNFGIVFFWLDRMFGTFRTDVAAIAINVFPGFHFTVGKRPEPGEIVTH